MRRLCASTRCQQARFFALLYLVYSFCTWANNFTSNLILFLLAVFSLHLIRPFADVWHFSICLDWSDVGRSTIVHRTNKLQSMSPKERKSRKKMKNIFEHVLLNLIELVFLRIRMNERMEWNEQERSGMVSAWDSSRAHYGTRANIRVVAGSKDFKRCWFIHKRKIFIQWKIKSHHKILFSVRVDFHLLRFQGEREIFMSIWGSSITNYSIHWHRIRI